MLECRMSIMFDDGYSYWPSGNPGLVFVVGYSQQYSDVSGDTFCIKYTVDQINALRAKGGFVPYKAVQMFGNPYVNGNAWYQRPQ